VSARYPCLNTEFWANGTIHPNTDIIADHERRGIGWLSFVNLKQIEQAFKVDIDAAGLVWVPDYGKWPTSSVAARARIAHRITDAVAPRIRLILPNGRGLSGGRSCSAGVCVSSAADGVWRLVIQASRSSGH